MRNKKTIFNATFEESQNLVDKEYIERSLKSSSNKQDLSRFWGKIVQILIGIIGVIMFKSPPTNPSINKKLIWSSEVFGKILITSYIIGGIYIISIIVAKIYFNRRKISREFNFNIGSIMATTISCAEISVVFLPVAGALLNSVFIEYLYVFLIIIISYRMIIKKNSNLMQVLYKGKQSDRNLEKTEKIINIINNNILVVIVAFVGVILKRIFSGIEDIQQIVITATGPIFIMIFAWLMWNIYITPALKGYYLEKYSEQYRILYNYSKEEWYGTGIDDKKRMELLNKRFEAEKVKSKSAKNKTNLEDVSEKP